MSAFDVAGDKSPDGTEWSRYASYCCIFCNERCLNRLDQPPAETRTCVGCLAEHLADDLAAALLLEGPDSTLPPATRQAVGLPCGRMALEGAEDGQKPGTAEGRARNVPRSGATGVPSRGDD
jgi:hypothetical protein